MATAITSSWSFGRYCRDRSNFPVARERILALENLPSPVLQNLQWLRASAAAAADCDRVTGLVISMTTSDHGGTSFATVRGGRCCRCSSRRRSSAASRRRCAGRGCRRASPLPEEGVVLPGRRGLSVSTTLNYRFRCTEACLKRKSPLLCFICRRMTPTVWLE